MDGTTFSEFTNLRVSLRSLTFGLFVLGIELRFGASRFFQVNGLDLDLKLLDLSLGLSVQNVVVDILSSLITGSEVIAKVGYFLLKVRDVAI